MEPSTKTLHSDNIVAIFCMLMFISSRDGRIS